jgi:peptidoglycan/xylan/chitin deacetylase (PgdA/CDA1 family)
MTITRRDFLKLGSAAVISLALPAPSPAAVFRIPVLMYHHIGAPSKEYETVLPAQFAAQMEWLYTEGYRAISIAELGELSVQNAEKTVLITVDDGQVSFIEYAFYLLREYGFKATANVIGRYVGGYVDENHPRFSWDECRYLMKSGLVDIGCHSYNLHDWNGYPSMAAAISAFNAKLEQDLTRFQQVYKRELGKSADILAWPFGIYDQKSLEIARKAGFKYFLNSDNRYVEHERERVDIPRLIVHNAVDLAKFRSMIERKS